MSRLLDDRYLGDDVYASFDGYHIILDLRGLDKTIRIALEPGTLQNLRDFQKDLALACQEQEEVAP